MSYPPPPHHDPNNPRNTSKPENPYAQPPQGGPGYGYPQQGSPPAYGYPQQPGGYADYPGGRVPMTTGMPGQVLAARVLLFVAGGLWALLAVTALIAGFAANDIMDDIPVADGAGGAAAGIGFVVFLIAGGISALHLVPASMFGKGGTGTRVTAIIAASLNALLPVLGLLGLAAQQEGGNPVLPVLWAGTAVVTLVFCSLRPAGEWFNRPRH